MIRLGAPTFSLGAIALIEYDGRMLALRQTHRRGDSLPGGLVDRHEHPADAVRREVLEETGLAIDPGDVVATVFETRLRHIDVIFRVVCDAEPVVAPASEATGFRWLLPHEWTDIDVATARILHAAGTVHDRPVVGRVLPTNE